MFCQKCRTPLRLDTSLEDLNPAALKLLIEATSRTLKGDPGNGGSSRMLYTPEQRARYDEAAKSSAGPVLKRSIPPGRESLGGRDRSSSTAADHPSMSFVMLTESQLIPPPMPEAKGRSVRSSDKRKSRGTDGDQNDLASYKVESSAKLFEILSSRSDVDHPICVECTDIIIDGMEKRLASAARERDAYAEYLRNANAELPTDEEARLVEEEIQAVRKEEEAALAELRALEQEKRELEEELAALDLESRELDEEEQKFLTEKNALYQVVADYEKERINLKKKFAEDSRQLEKLQRTNVWSDTFNIQYDSDGFGTINGLRLGRKSGKMVEWAEVNAAWGQALLLLVVVAEKLKYTFNGYRLNPMGSTSTIEKWETGPQASSRDQKPVTASLQLFYSSDLPLSIGFLHRHFDAAMIAFLECVRQLGAHIERTDTNVNSKSLPFEIKKDKIDNVSIKLGSFNGDENWTRACKLTLTCCKFCLAHASIVDLARRE